MCATTHENRLYGRWTQIMRSNEANDTQDFDALDAVGGMNPLLHHQGDRICSSSVVCIISAQLCGQALLEINCSYLA